MTNPTILLSFVAGVLSFLSPCILPLIPSYLSYIGGVSLAELRSSTRADSGVVMRTLLFIAGFSVVFVALGVVFSGTGLLLNRLSSTINLIAGILIVLLALNMIFDFWKFLDIEQRPFFKTHARGKIGGSGYAGSFAIGMAFGAGWTPCVGPILAGILFLASRSGAVGTGVLYLTSYSLGLGLPFLLASLFFSRVTAQLNRLKRHFATIRIASGLLLAAIGLLIAFGRLRQFNSFIVGIGAAAKNWGEQSPGSASAILGTISLAIGFLCLLPYVAGRLKQKSGAVDSEGQAVSVQPRRLSPVAVLFALFFGVIALLEYTGTVDLTAFLYHWLTFQGI
ncbi:MAG TPA: cytochrome c biogenesis protein CcdA [Spirochaetia bacterium]|nr:cytochrome c biogenesis protein CcdA [Spirochaetia bacterium]